MSHDESFRKWLLLCSFIVTYLVSSLCTSKLTGQFATLQDSWLKPARADLQLKATKPDGSSTDEIK